MEVIAPRDVPLGGLRAMNVRRTLPSRERTTIGAWCFLDHYGPDDVTVSEPMVVPPHPHTGLATVSWLFTGEVDHNDSAGNRARVRPGALNLMTAGRGISHSEYSTPETTILHGCQLWLALPDEAREIEPGFQAYVPPPVAGDGWEARVFLGSLLGSTSPVATHTPLLGAEITLSPGASLTLDLDPAFEHGVLLDTGAVAVDGTDLPAAHLAHLPTGTAAVTLRATEPTRVMLIGGTPFGEQIVMWWNFIGRSHEEVVAYRHEWESLLATGEQDRFGLPADDPMDALHAPALPGVRLKPRG
ncbi:pirin family protein [Nocardioides montaniterrae]